MIAVGQKVAIAAAAFATFGMSLALMPAQASAQRISGTISFPASFLPHGFNSRVCQDFTVIATEPAAVVLGKTASGTITASVKGGTVTCAYSLEMLQVPSGQVTVEADGHPLGFKPRLGSMAAFYPGRRTVNGKRCRPTCSFSNVDFAFVQYLV
jgi:hypothetical protein